MRIGALESEMHSYLVVAAVAMIMLFCKAQSPATIKPGQELPRCVRAIKTYLAHCGYNDIQILRSALLVYEDFQCIVLLTFSHYRMFTLEKTQQFLCQDWDGTRFRMALAVQQYVGNEAVP